LQGRTYQTLDLLIRHIVDGSMDTVVVFASTCVETLSATSNDY